MKKRGKRRKRRKRRKRKKRSVANRNQRRLASHARLLIIPPGPDHPPQRS
jgi:hypothetical protein